MENRSKSGYIFKVELKKYYLIDQKRGVREREASNMTTKGLFVCLFVYLFLAALGLRCCVRAFSS